ncbi:NAD(P)/FAD-dependent oxidoreductase [soil metagenome]
MRAVVVGGGHNGLVAACSLARAGCEVTVLEQAGKPGGGSRTDETVPGYRFDTHSAAHNIINMTSIPAELRLAEAGLVYQEMEPFAAGFFADGAVVRFHRSIEATVASIAEHDPAEARRYADLMDRALPLVAVAVAGLAGGSSLPSLLRTAGGRLGSLAKAVRRFGGPAGLVHDLIAPYGALLETHLGSELTRAPVSAFAAHSSAGPHVPGGSFYALWQAAYHRFGQWHARGGSQALIDALTIRLSSYGGVIRTGARVTRIEAPNGRVRAVVLADGQRLPADHVITAIDPGVALLELCDPPLSGPAAAELRAVHRGNAVQMVVHVATTALPAYRGARAGDWNGLQSHVDTVAELTRGFRAAEARVLPDPAPTYAFTPSALDPGLALAGRHTVYLACPCAPYDVDGGWDAHGERFAEAMIDSMEAHAPGFRDTIVGVAIRTPALMAQELLWPGAHPMVSDISLDQLAFLRPTRRLASHRTPIEGLVISGGGTAPTGGIAGVPGKAAAAVVLCRRL